MNNKNFKELTVSIILTEMVNTSKKLKTKVEFDTLIKAYSKRIVKSLSTTTNTKVCNCGTEAYAEPTKRADGLYYCSKCNKRY